MVDRYQQDVKLYTETYKELKEAFKERNMIA